MDLAHFSEIPRVLSILPLEYGTGVRTRKNFDTSVLLPNID